MIVVGIVNPTKTRVRDLTITPLDKQNPNQLENADRFLDFVEKEVIPFVKQQYRTLDYQILSGTSHGGQFAINTLVKRPDLFHGIIAISPSLYPNHFKMQVSVGVINALDKALIAENSYSLFKINNAA